MRGCSKEACSNQDRATKPAATGEQAGGTSQKHAFVADTTDLGSLCLQHLNIQGATYALDSLKAPLCSRSAAQQLQALHTENLQLKACLKQEVEARQQLERKHRELLDLLRCTLR